MGAGDGLSQPMNENEVTDVKRIAQVSRRSMKVSGFEMSGRTL